MTDNYTIDVTTPTLTVDVTEPTYTIELTTPGVSEFDKLTDTPSSKTGNSLKFVRVNAAETDLEYSSVTGTGDVVGPSSATDNSLVTFDNTTGKLIQDSGLISEGNKIYQSGYPNTYIKFNNGTLEIWAGGIIQAGWS